MQRDLDYYLEDYLLEEALDKKREMKHDKI